MAIISKVSIAVRSSILQLKGENINGTGGIQD
jgi:hypothetical protein